jgi:anti-sigma regulatory factor (Ser/Thr protein kinase)
MSVLLYRGPCEPGATAQVRRSLRSLARAAQVPEDMVEDLALAATELITNAINAGAHHVDVSLSVPPPHLQLEVTDDAPGIPEMGDPDPLSVHGRGLQILTAIAEMWGYRSHPHDGKTVWARFDAET